MDYNSILLTGAAGFIGSNFLEGIIKKGVDVICVDNLSSGSLSNISAYLSQKNIKFFKLDIREEKIKELVKDVDIIVHFAAIVSVQRSIKNPSETNDVNVNGTLNILNAAIRSDVKKIIFASSSAIYGDRRPPLSEEDPSNPKSPYAVSKLACEQYLKVFYELYGLESVVLRYFNVYGPKQGINEYAAVIPKFIMQAMKNKAITIYGDGLQTRDFIFVKDAVNACMLAIEKSKGFDIFNIATGKPTRIIDLAKLIKNLLNSESEIVHLPPREGEIRHSFANVDKARDKLGFEPKYELTEGLKETISWFRRRFQNKTAKVEE